jgi:very-short-patch-repair endonuclease
LVERLLVERVSKGVTGSALEDRFVRLIVRAKLPEPVRQFEVRDDQGRFIARLDFAYPAARIAIEIDGFAFHSGRRAWQKDLVRQNALVDARWVVLRFTKLDITSESARTIETVRRVLGQKLSVVDQPR